MQELMRQIIAPTATMLSLTALQILINSKRKNRAQQLIRVVIAAVFAVTEIVSALMLERRLINLLNGLSDTIRSFIPADLIERFHLGDLVNSLLDTNNLINKVGEALVLNLALYSAYVLLRMVPGAVNRFLQKNKIFFQKYAEIFYEYDEEYDQWFIREKWTNVREMFKFLSWAGAAATGVVLAVTCYLQTKKGISVLIFPAMAHMVVVEFFGFINGYTKEEFEHVIGGDDSHSQKISNYYKIREIYEKIFPKEILVSHTGCEYVSAGSTLDLLEELRKGDRTEAMVSHFFTINEAEENYDTDCILAVKELMKGENVIFFNPFYRDLGKYIVLPMMTNLLKGRKCLIIVGRNSAREDIKVWMRDLLWETSKIRSMWRVDDLSFKMPDCEVGVLGFSQLYDSNILEANKEFLKQVKFVIILEASLMINTGQVGLNILAGQMVNYSDRPAYCILDRMTDGLVDTMSHLLQSEITKVVAPPVSRNLHTGMAWNADGDYLRQKLFGKQTRYLGNGMELAAVAIKNQVQEVCWFSERKAPIRDIKWIAGQYFPALCQYMNLPIQQKSIYEKINFISNIWSVPEKSEQFLIAEDEFMNMFSTMRTFLSRGKDQTFVNVLSENYLLRDYMRCNPGLFHSNPNAVPSLVPDYAKTERNTLIKLLLLMSYDSVSESQIREEFNLMGIETDDVLHSMNDLLSKYTNADGTLFSIRTVAYAEDGLTVKDENIYSIPPDKFEEFFGEDLRNAYYICEEEKSDTEYIEARLFGHVTQTILPGQMVTYDGKYYIAEYVTPKSGVILRRASNLYDGRKYYRQIRNYVFSECAEKEVVSSKKIMDIELTKYRTDFEVLTTGYLQMNSNNDLRSARVIDFSEDPSVGSYVRKYHNKAVLRLKLPDTNDQIRFTFSMLFSETLRSVFPEGWPYIAVLCKIPSDVDGMLNYMIYGIEGQIDEEAIYIVEDSTVDLGLLEAIEKNFLQFMEIVTDFLFWHFEKIQEGPEEAPKARQAEFPETGSRQKKKGGLSGLIDKVKGLFSRKKKAASTNYVKPSGPQQKPADSRPSGQGDAAVGVKSADAGYNASLDKTDIFDTDSFCDESGYFEEDPAGLGNAPQNRSRYQEECYLNFGFGGIDRRIVLDETKRYLTARGFSNNSLTKARKRDVLEPAALDLQATNHCDFCGVPISGVSYQRLSDGRIRCNDCGATAITSVEDFKKIFYQSLELMQSFYGIEIKSPVFVKTTDAKTVARGFGAVFTPSTEMTARVLGYAQRKGQVFNLVVENGSPRLATIETMVHELTHIWQYINWDDKEIGRLYPGREKHDIIYEGMAVWVAVQYLYLIGESSYAMRQEVLQASREDVYGVGFRMYLSKYPLIKDASLVSYSPFTVFPPI